MEKEIFVIQKSDFPQTLQNIHRPPGHLYIRGTLPKETSEHRYLCVVGSRSYTEYGKAAVNNIIRGLAGYPITIVSGLAFGIDSIAHQAALDAGLTCMTFPGSTLEWNSIYPPPHIDLARKIVENDGCLISQWQSNYPTGTWAFPARNRLMAGISHATLIVEARKGSGSLMTAKYAEEFDREVMAIPGPIDSPSSYGPHMLIKNGAACITSAEDILDAFGFVYEKQLNLTSDSKNSNKQTNFQYSHLDQISQKIIQIIQRGNHSEDLIRECIEIGTTELNQKLSELEIYGVIEVDRTGIKLLGVK